MNLTFELFISLASTYAIRVKYFLYNYFFGFSVRQTEILSRLNQIKIHYIRNKYDYFNLWLCIHPYDHTHPINFIIHTNVKINV